MASNYLYYEIARRLRSSPRTSQVTRPCTLAPPPPSPTEKMDSKLWGNLQDHIGLERVFSKLPFREFFQLRLVCKDFNARACDENFLKANANPLCKKPFFCLVHPYGDWQVFMEYDKVSNEWYQLPIPTPKGTNDGLPPKWSAGRFLIYTEGKQPDYWIFTIFDLFTRMQYKLPLLYRDIKSYDREWNLEGLVVNQLVNITFQVVIAEMGSTNIRTSIYDFVTTGWDQKIQPFPLELDDFEVFSSPPQGSVYHNGNLYVSMHEVPYIMSYDLATGAWSSFDCPSEFSRAIDLGCWNGCLYAISSQWDQETGTFELYVYQLFEGTNKRWNEVCPIPLDLFGELFETNDPSPTWNECDTFLKTCVEDSFCDEYVFITVFLQDYLVIDSRCDGYKVWFGGNLVPSRFALLNLETEKWELLNFPISKDRQRMELGIEDCSYAYQDRKRVKKMIMEKLEERKYMRR